MGLAAKIILALSGLVFAGVAAALLLSGLAVRERNAALALQARMVETRFGAVEYAEAGAGEALLVLHGAGGGFDQGIAIAQAFAPPDRRVIAPSRFGYLGSDLPEDPSTANQADALAELLNALNLDRVDIMAFSGGVPPALKLAERHPHRVRRLVLMSSAPFTPYEEQPADRRAPTALYQALFLNDAIYWTLTQLAPDLLASAFDARPDLRTGLASEEEAFVAAVVDGFLPASRRRAGVLNEGAAIAPDAIYDLARIQSDTLIVHARDDAMNPFAVAERIAADIPESRLLAFDTGGHLLLTRHEQVRALVQDALSPSDAQALTAQ
jgi:pimeloyl-ACP methyl ester carboxylesterase